MLQLIGQFAAEEAGGIGALGLDMWSILASSATFLALFMILKKFALGRIVKALEDRRLTIERGLKLTHEMDRLKEELDEKVESSLKEARKDADTIIKNAQAEAAGIIDQATEAASRKAEDVLARAEAKINRDIDAARSDLMKEVKHFVRVATETVLEEKLDDAKDEQLIQSALKGVAK